MAFIPDDATERERELTPNARIVYHAHCRFRKHEYRVSFATDEEIARRYGLSLGSVRNANTELKRKGWIDRGDNFTRLIVGDFSPVDRKHSERPLPKRRLARAAASQTAPEPAQPEPINYPELPFETVHESMIPDHETVNENHETMIRNHESMIENHESVNFVYIDRARDLPASITSQENQPHTPAARAREDSGEAPSARVVCVSERIPPRDGIRFEDCIAYAQAQPNVLSIPALARSTFDDPIGRALVRAWLVERTPERVAERARASPDDGLIPLHLAQQQIASLISAGADAATEIERIRPEVLPSTWARLTEQFLTDRARERA